MSNYIDEFFSKHASIDTHLSRNPAGDERVRRSVAERSRRILAGTRVVLSENTENLFTYQVPHLPMGGTVVKVRTSSGDTTQTGDRTFVLFDDGVIRHVLCRHLSRARQSRKHQGKYRRVVSNLGDLSGFMRSPGGSNELIHKSTKDLWSVSRDGGEYVIERLFEETGEPLKV